MNEQTPYSSEATPSARGCILRPGNTNCGGCGMSVGLQLLDRALDGDAVTLCIPACCGIVTAGGYPSTAYGVPTVATTFASSPAVASGIRSVQQLNGDPGLTLCWAGDGGTYDIGVATLSAAAERGEDLIYLCYDNEIYGNTGGQRSSATPAGAVTSTTPGGKGEEKKDIMAIMVAHRVPYAATISVAHPEDALRKLRYARGVRGFRFFLILSPCPTGWKSEPGESVELVRAAVRCGLFPVYEVFDGRRYRINVRPDGSSPMEYFSRQRRFPAGQLDEEAIRGQIAVTWDTLDKLADAFPASEGEGFRSGNP